VKKVRDPGGETGCVPNIREERERWGRISRDKKQNLMKRKKVEESPDEKQARKKKGNLAAPFGNTRRKQGS